MLKRMDGSAMHWTCCLFHVSNCKLLGFCWVWLFQKERKKGSAVCVCEPLQWFVTVVLLMGASDQKMSLFVIQEDMGKWPTLSFNLRTCVTGVIQTGNMGSERRVWHTARMPTTRQNTACSFSTRQPGCPYILKLSCVSLDVIWEAADSMLSVWDMQIKPHDNCITRPGYNQIQRSHIKPDKSHEITWLLTGPQLRSEAC